MEDADMTGEGEEQQQQPKSEKIATALSTLASVASVLSARSRAIPSNTDFHFYNNFPEFKSPARQATAVAAPAIAAVSSAPVLRLRNGPFPSKDDSVDDLLDYVVNLNDELLERFGASMDEFKLERTKEEENAKTSVVTGEDGFQLVVSKNNKKKSSKQESSPSSNNQATGVSVASKDKRTNGTTKPKVPFHIPSIPRPQDEYRIIVNNTNTPFQHVWLEQNGEESLVHPLEKLSVLDFMDKKESEPIKPAPIESTPFKLVETLDDLKAMVAKLKNVSEFAVDLEHNSYRSYQGLTCLMQISTRTEDFIVDTFKVRIILGSYMRDLFKDPTKRKVMHGADHDIMWLQRDFGIYVCNLFDTGQASRVLELERNSLEFLLHHFCDVTANKEYQNADWRLRPLPAEMVKYAKEDTHYLLYIYDLMRNRLISESTKETDLLLEVYNRSKEICLQMYEKELLTDTSFLSIYGVQQAELNARQLAIVSGLYQWRDIVARNEDESTGYVLPNKTLIEIAKEMPVTSDKLLKFVKSRHSYIERNIHSILEIIRNSISQAHAFEPIALQLKINQIGKAKAKEEMENVEQKCPVVQIAPQKPPSFRMTHPVTINNNSNNVVINNNVEVESSQKKQGLNIGAAPFNHTLTVNQGSKKASVQITKKPAAAFGALFGKPSRTGSITISTPFNQKQEESKNKLEKIKQTVALPFYFGASSNINNNISFSNEIIMQSAPVPFEPEKMQVEEPITNNTTKMEDIILLETEKEDGNNSTDSSDKEESVKHKEWLPHPSNTNGSDSDSDSETDATQLSSSFEKCFKSVNELRNNNNCKASTQSVPTLQLKPFDYSAARNAMFHSGKNTNNDDDDGDDDNEEGNNGRKSNKTKRSKKERGGEKGEKEKGFQQARRRQAFPMSGNRSTTYF